MFEKGDWTGEESLGLLREQTAKLRANAKDLQLKEEQVRFLKETILSLEQEKDAVAHHNHQLKMKLKTMAAEIADYNANVVQKIYQENQDLHLQLKTLQDHTQNLQEQLTQANAQLRLQQNLSAQELAEKEQLRAAQEALQQARGKQDKRTALLEKDNRELQQKNLQLQRQVEETAQQLNYCSQQIDLLTQKHHEAVKLSERRAKQAAERTVPKEEAERLEKELRETQNKTVKLTKELDKAKREHEKLRLQLLGCRDRLLSQEIREETRSSRLRADLLNLAASAKLGRRVAEFESEQQQQAAAVLDLTIQSSEQLQKANRALQMAQDRIRVIQSDLRRAQEAAEVAHQQVSQVSQRQDDLKQSLQAEYEARLMEISIRLRKQELSLASLRGRQTGWQQQAEQWQQRQEEWEQREEQHQLQKQTLKHTVEQLSRQNTRLGQELGQAIKLCEQNLVNRESLSYYKYTLQEVLTVVHYLHRLLLTRKAETRALFVPFLQLHLRRMPPRKLRSLQRWRKAVWVVVGVLRLRRGGGTGSRGLQRLAGQALSRRDKIDNLAGVVEGFSGLVLGGGGCLQVLRASGDVYRWHLPDYPQVRLSV